MNDDIAQAFAHPQARASATPAGATLPDRISLSDYVRRADIGAFQQERGAIQRLAFNVVVELSAQPATLDDDVDRILSYETITEAIDTELAAERLNLLETLAERIARRVLASPLAARIFVRIEKLDVGPYALGVEIVRSREEAGLPIEGNAVRPVIFHLADSADPGLPALIDRIEAGAIPAILCTGPTHIPPRADDPLAQRRIDLLAIEQAAWVLAGRDSRCIVTASRTELDWALKHGRISVWAPAKLVLDTPGAPKGPVDPAVLAGWLATHLDASELVAIGAQVGAGTVPVRQVSIAEAP